MIWIGSPKRWRRRFGWRSNHHPGHWSPVRMAIACWPKEHRQLRAQTDRAVIGLFGGNLLEVGQFLYRIDNFLMLLAGNPQRAHEFLDRLVELHLAESGTIS